MQEIETNQHVSKSDDQVDLRELFFILYDGKWIIVFITTCLSIIGVIYSLLLPNIYESRALLVPANSSGSISSALRGYSGLAGLAGVSLPAETENNSKKAIAKIPTLSFFESDILPNIFLPDLKALNYWDSKRNILIYDESIYNKDTNSWIVDPSNSKKGIPTVQESHKAFKERISVSEDVKTGFVKISTKHESPFVAQKWNELIVTQINSFYRDQDKIKSEKAVSYLNQKIATTNFSEVKKSIAELLSEETQKLTLIEANDFYVFEYIDSPAAMEKKSEPSRALICILFALLGGIISVLIVLIKHYIFKKQFT